MTVPSIRVANAAICLSWSLMVPVVAWADSWSFPATIKTEPDVYGDLTIRRIRDARKDQKYPDYSIEVTRGDRLLARIPGVYYEKLFPAPDGSFFVGLSNYGLSETAVVIVDREGRLRIEVKHGMAEFDYCDRSVTIQRVWFDAENPKVTFVKDPKWDVYAVKVRTCKGKEVDLMAEIRDAYNRSFQRNASSVRWTLR